MVGFSSNSKWTVLFDGKTVKGLRGYKQSGFPDSWEVVDGTLKTVPGHGIDLISEEVYSNFELELIRSRFLKNSTIERVNRR